MKFKRSYSAGINISFLEKIENTGWIGFGFDLTGQKYSAVLEEMGAEFGGLNGTAIIFTPGMQMIFGQKKFFKYGFFIGLIGISWAHVDFKKSELTKLYKIETDDAVFLVLLPFRAEILMTEHFGVGIFCTGVQSKRAGTSWSYHGTRIDEFKKMYIYSTQAGVQLSMRI